MTPRLAYEKMCKRREEEMVVIGQVHVLHLLQIVILWHGSWGCAYHCAYGSAPINSWIKRFFSPDSFLGVASTPLLTQLFCTVCSLLAPLIFFSSPCLSLTPDKRTIQQKKRSFNIYAIIESGKLFQITLHLSLLCSCNSPSVTSH